MGLEGVKVGDSVTIHGGYSAGPLRISTVARLTKTKVVLADESEWNIRNGRAWGAGYSYGGSWARPSAEGDAGKIRHIYLSQKMTYRVTWSKLSLETLTKVNEVLEAEEKGK